MPNTYKIKSGKMSPITPFVRLCCVCQNHVAATKSLISLSLIFMPGRKPTVFWISQPDVVDGIDLGTQCDEENNTHICMYACMYISIHIKKFVSISYSSLNMTIHFNTDSARCTRPIFRLDFDWHGERSHVDPGVRSGVTISKSNKSLIN